jgi:hypothetical protein
MMQTAFLYRWTQASTGMWYVGSRTAKNCHPSDGYICSSKHVKPLIETDPDDWKREVLLIAPPLYVREIEAKYLLFLNARDDTLSFNRHNGDMKFHTVGRKLSEEHKRKISPKGRVRSEATKAKLRAKKLGDKNPFFGKTHTPEYLQQVKQRMLTDNPSKREDVKQKLAVMFKGRPMPQTRTPEALAKKVVSAKRAWAEGLYDNRKQANWIPTDEQRAKMREARAKQTPPSLGKTHSPETKAKMAESRRLYWANRRGNV